MGLLLNHLCPSVCLSSLLRSPFLFDFDENLHRSWGTKNKNAFVGSTYDDPFPYFQWEGPNAAVTRPVERLWRLRAQTTCLGSGYKHKVAKCCKPQFCPLKHKNGEMHFQLEYAWLSVWHILSQQRCEIERWFQRTIYRKLHIRSPMVTWLMTSRDPKRSRSWPNIFQAL